MKTRKIVLMACALVMLLATQALAGVSLEVLNPASSIELTGKLAPRLSDLNGKRVAMWLSGPYKDAEGLLTGNGMGEVIYDTIAADLKAKYPNVTIVPYTDLPIDYENWPAPLEAVLATNPDAVIVGAGG